MGSPSSLGAFIDILRREGEIVEVETSVEPRLEVAEIHRRVIEQEGPALLFRNPANARYPLVTNLFGTLRRVQLAFGSRPEELVKEIAELPKTFVPPNLSKMWSHRRTLSSLFKIGFSTRNKDASTIGMISESPKLSDLPVLTTWIDDGGPFFTLPLVFTQDPITKVHNLGMYRLQRYDDSTTGLHCQIGKGGGYHLKVAQELGTNLPVNVFLGGPPALTLAAIAPLPENVPELLFASLVLGKKINLISDSSSALPIVAEAEFCLSGTVDPNEVRLEGPFGDHYGYYSLQHDYPVFRCQKVFRKPNPIYPATVVGKPRQEDFFIGEYLQNVLRPLFPVVMPNVLDLWSYGETGFHSLAAAVIKQRYKREALSAGFRILGEGQLALTKFLLLVDTPQDLTNFRALLEFVLERADFRTDLYVFSNSAMDTLDYAGPKVNEGSKGLLLASGRPVRELPGAFSGSIPAGVRRAVPFCRGCLVVEGPAYDAEPDFVHRIARHPEFASWPLIVVSDDAATCASSDRQFLWMVFTRFEPAADIHAAKVDVVRNHLSYNSPVVLDARMKPWYPGTVETDSKTFDLVSSRWNEYKIKLDSLG